MNAPDLDVVFDNLPGCSVLVSARAPRFTIVAVTDCYADVTFTKRSEIIGQPFFDVFSDNPAPQKAQGIHNLIASFHQVTQQQQPHKMAVQKYDVYYPQQDEFVEKYWDPFNNPIQDRKGKLKYILHTVTDVTIAVKLKQGYQQMSERESKEGKVDRAASKSQTGVALFYGSYLAVSYMNDVLLQLLGRDREEVIGRPGLTLFTRHQPGTDLAGTLLEAYITKKPISLKAVTLWAVDNKKFNFHSSVKKYVLDITFEPLIEVSGQMYGVAAFFNEAH